MLANNAIFITLSFSHMAATRLTIQKEMKIEKKTDKFIMIIFAPNLLSQF